MVQVPPRELQKWRLRGRKAMPSRVGRKPDVREKYRFDVPKDFNLDDTDDGEG